ncbi:MAG TPA: hypothetical protein VGJ57_08180 [Nitrospirales bacterium]
MINNLAGPAAEQPGHPLLFGCNGSPARSANYPLHLAEQRVPRQVAALARAPARRHPLDSKEMGYALVGTNVNCAGPAADHLHRLHFFQAVEGLRSASPALFSDMVGVKVGESERLG